MSYSNPIFSITVLFLLLGQSFGASWREMRNQPGANFYDILKAHEVEMAGLQKLDKKLGGELFEELEEGDFQFERWRHRVEPRVQPSGELSLLNNLVNEMRPWMGLNGEKSPQNAGAWTPLGPIGDPAGRAFTGIPSGNGRLHHVRFHPTNPNIFYTGSPGGGLWVSLDAGNNWKAGSDKIAALSVNDIVVDPKNTNTLYISTGDRDGGDVSSIGLLKSIDGGLTWNTTGLTWDVSLNKDAGRVLINPSNSSMILHAGSDGVNRSTDGGVTFSKATGTSGNIRAMEFHPTDPNIVYASGGTVYYSTNGGQSFTAATGPSTLSASRVVLAVSPAAPEKVWAYTSSSNLHVSVNGGRSFTFVGVGADVGQSTYNLSVAVSHTNPDYVITGQVQMKKSIDGGKTFTAFQTGSHWDVHGLDFQTGTNTAFSANDGGVYRSINGGNWTPMNAGFQIGQMYRIGVSRSNPERICNGLQDNGSVLYTGSGWTRIGAADSFECFFDPVDPNTVYLEIYNGAHDRCTWNASSSSASCTRITSGLAGGGLWDTPWGIDPNSTSTLYSARAGTLYKSTNKGTNWSALGTLGGSGSITQFSVAPSNSNVIYVIRGSGMHRTTNGGSSWASISIGISGSPTYVATDKGDPNKAWVTISGYTANRKVFRTIDGGQNWTAFSEGLPNLPANTIVSEGGAGNGVYVGMDVGVYYRNNSMTSWVAYFDGLPNVSVNELEIGGTGNTARLKAATYGRGAWESPLWGVITVIHPEKAKLSPNISDFKITSKHGILEMGFHMNTTHIQHTLSLYTAKGRLAYQSQIPGKGFFKKQFDVSAFNKGSYFLKISSTAILQRFVVL